MSSQAALITQEEKQKQKEALAHLQAAVDSGDVSSERLEDAKRFPALALVNERWKMRCCLWNGRELGGYTTNEDRANQAKDKFGWDVVKEEGWIYKYSLTIDDEETEGWLKWINPLQRRSAMIPWSMDASPEDIEEARKKWDDCYIQTGPYFAMELRRPFLQTNKNKPLDITNTLLPRTQAKMLSRYLGDGRAGLEDDVREWIRKSATNSPEPWQIR